MGRGPLSLLGYRLLLPHPAMRIQLLSGPLCSDKPQLGGIPPVSIFWVVSVLKHCQRSSFPPLEASSWSWLWGT